MINRYNLLTRQFSEENQTRPELGGIFITPKETVATDSFTMIRVSTPDYDIDEFPIIPNEGKPIENFNPFILPKKQAKKIEKMIPKKAELPVIKNAVVLDQNEENVKLGTSDLESGRMIRSQIIKGDYPNYQKLYSKSGKRNTAEVNVKYLYRVAKFFKKFTKGNTVKSIRVENPNGESKPIWFYAENEDTGQKAEALVMPIENA